MPAPNLTSFTAGAFTLSGWVTAFTGVFPPHFEIGWGTGQSNFVFNWGPAGTDGGSDSPQVIGITDSSAGADSVSLSLHFNTTESGLYIANGANAGNTLFTASSDDTYVLGSTGGESAASLLSDLKSLQLVDTNKNDFFSISFQLTDVTAANASLPGSTKSFQEAFTTACYAPGTRITTPAGEVAVEDLQIGDMVTTTSGIARPVKWIGRRHYSAAAVAEFANLRPVLIRQEALAPGLPHRDLVVSPMHALFIDDVFIPAAALVNGVSILRRAASGPVEYIHVELDGHEVIFAEGVPAETFVDDNSRAMFENVSEYYDLYGFAESARGFCAPRLEEGYQLDAVRRRLAARAGIGVVAAAPGALAGHVERLADGVLEGWVIDRENPAAPVELEVLVDGEIVATVLANRYRVDLDRAGLAGGSCAFTVAMPAAAVALAQIEVRRAADGSAVPRPVRALASAY
jgi:hypothetical protein